MGKLTAFNFLRYPKVGDLDSTFIVDENIGTFDISMDDLPFMEIIETGEDLSNEVSYKRFFESAIVAQESGHGPARNVFEENV